MVLAELSLFPLDKGTHLSGPVAKAVDLIAKSGLTYQLTAMGTLIEGEWDDVMKLVTACYDEMKKDSDRIYLTLKIDAKQGAKDQLKEKVAHVEEKLGR